jgi:hypothetical protein
VSKLLIVRANLFTRSLTQRLLASPQHCGGDQHPGDCLPELPARFFSNHGRSGSMESDVMLTQRARTRQM